MNAKINPKTVFLRQFRSNAAVGNWFGCYDDIITIHSNGIRWKIEIDSKPIKISAAYVRMDRKKSNAPHGVEFTCVSEYVCVCMIDIEMDYKIKLC